MNRFLISLLAVSALGAPAMAASLKVDTSKNCSFTIEMMPDVAPKHVAQITKLAKAGFYNGIVFHRVIDGFMAQTGDPTGTGGGGSKEPNLNAEFSTKPFVRGTVGMARTNDPNSANSQFFVMFADGAFLNGQYTVWGHVDGEGMKCVDSLKKGDPQSGAVDGPDKMIKVTVQ
ncbi:MAG: peptidylprolyl isomerase [Alphaproteobacteria bacterium]|nr:peptidylprolyl isomerase [Alphaproteobacteria bacterium]